MRDSSEIHVDDALVSMTARYLKYKLRVRRLYEKLDATEERMRKLEKEIDKYLPNKDED